MHSIACDVYDEKGGSPVCMKLLTTQRTTAALQQILQSFFGFLAMVSRVRLAADPSVGVADVVRALQEALEEEGSRDLLRLLHHKYQFTWKSAPDAEWLGGDFVSKLYKKLFQIHVNGVMQGKKVKTALLKLQTEKGRLNFTKLHDSDWADQVDEVLRIGAAMYRDMKKDSLKYSRCTKKASPQEKQHIDDVLCFLQLGQEEELSVVATEKGQVQRCTELPVDAKDKEQELPGLKIFGRVLQKQASDPQSPSFKQKQGEKIEKVQEPSSGSGLKRNHRVLSVESFEKDEKKELSQWMKTAGDPGKPRQGKEKKNKKEKPEKKPAARTKKTGGDVKGKLPQGMHKSSFRNRASSTAYHKARKEALRQGLGEEEALAQARKACAKVKDDIDSGILKEEG